MVLDKGNEPLEKTDLNVDAEQDREFVEENMGDVSAVIHARVSKKIAERVSEDPFEESLGQYVERMSENDVVVATDFITIVTNIYDKCDNHRSAKPKKRNTLEWEIYTRIAKNSLGPDPDKPQCKE